MGKMQMATGEVTSVNPNGAAITLSEKVGSETLDAGTIVDKDSVVKVGGKPATLQDIRSGIRSPSAI